MDTPDLIPIDDQIKWDVFHLDNSFDIAEITPHLFKILNRNFWICASSTFGKSHTMQDTSPPGFSENGCARYLKQGDYCHGS